MLNKRDFDTVDILSNYFGPVVLKMLKCVEKLDRRVVKCKNVFL